MISLLAAINVPIMEAFTNLVTRIALCILCIVFCKMIISTVIIILLQNKTTLIITLSILYWHIAGVFSLLRTRSELLLAGQLARILL